MAKKQEKVEKRREIVESILHPVYLKRNHEFQIAELKTVVTTKIEIKCFKHNKTIVTTVRKYRNAKFGIGCCVSAHLREISGNKKLGKPFFFEKVSKIASQRDHEISNFNYFSSTKCFFTVFCKKHQMTYDNIQYMNYTHTNVKWGISCCSSRISSLPENEAQKRYKEVIQLATERNHQIFNWVYRNKKDCSFSLTCWTHNQIFADIPYGTYTSPMNSNEKWGNIPCCVLDVKHLEAEKRTGFKKLLNIAERKNYEISNLSDLFEKNSLLTVHFTVKCRNHNQVFDNIDYRGYIFGTGIPCCSKKTKIEKAEEQKALKKVTTLAERRGHRIVNFEYPGPTVKECHFTVKCLKHNETDNMVRYKIYSQTNNKSGGLACCKRKSVKTFRTPVSKTKMWIRELCSQTHVQIPTCQMTGLVSSSEQQRKIVVVGHHLYSDTKYPILSKLPQNGILLLDLIHREFHKQFPNSRMITPKTFLLFLQQFLKDTTRLKLLITSIEENYSKKLDRLETQNRILVLIKHLNQVLPFLHTCLLNPETFSDENH